MVRKNTKDRFSQLKGKKVFITGGSGFIGSHLAMKLIECGAKVTVFDIYKDASLKGVDFIKGDVMDCAGMTQAMKGHDLVIHAAAMLGVEKIIKIPLDVMTVNVEGTVNALKAACKNKIDRLLFVSSSEVYGDSDSFPLREDEHPAPISIYGISKLSGEAYCLSYCKQKGLKTTCTRMFNVYGPGQKENFVIPKFIANIASGKPPIIYGHGNQSRCYTYISDAVKGIMLALISDKAVGEVINIGNTEEVTVLELANYLIDHMNSDVKPAYQLFGDGIRVEGREIFRRQPDILKAMTRLGFDIEVPWKVGMAKFCDWFVANNKK